MSDLVKRQAVHFMFPTFKLV